MFKPLFAPNGTQILRPGDFNGDRTPQSLAIGPEAFLKETAADYVAPVVGTSPNGLGFNFSDSWRRTGRGTMEFQLPMGQIATINASLKIALENVFIGKAMRLLTDFTCKGLRNNTGDAATDTFFDSVIAKLNLAKVYRQAVWLYNTVGLVPILMPEPGKPLSYVQLLDPRQVRVQQWYGKTYMYMLPDKRMLAAIQDPKGTASPFNRDYYNAMPNDWKQQIQAHIKQNGGNVGEGMMIRLKEGSFTVIQNRDCAFDRNMESWDGAPLQSYFAAAEQYRMLMAGDFAAAFLAKNLVALVTIGDPHAEGDNYIRPDGAVLANLQGALQNPNQAQYVYADPTFNIRYLTPDTDTFASEKYAEPKEQLKNLLPSCFWYGDSGSYADSQVSVKEVQERCDNCNNEFDEYLWKPLFSRAAEGRARVSKQKTKAPEHDRNSLRDEGAWLTANSALYANGGLPVSTLLEAHGYDPAVIRQKMLDQQDDVKKGLWAPAFESKQGIVAGMYEKDGLIPSTQPASSGGSSGGSKKTTKTRTRTKNKPDGKPGRPQKPGAKPQAEKNGPRTPRPSEGK